MSTAEPCEHRLRVVDGRGSRRAVARVTDRNGSFDRPERTVIEAVGHEPERAIGVGLSLAVDRDKPRRLLSAMLEGVEPEARELHSVGVSIDANNATHGSVDRSVYRI